MRKKYILRIRYVRGDDVKFISHLDTMRTFQRAMARAQIPVAFSSGFNPSPRIIFGLPISLGFTSTSEYADIELTRRIPAGDFVSGINGALPDALKVLKARYVDGGKNIMASVAMAAYEIDIGGTEGEIFKGEMESFLKKDAIMVEKKTKKRTSFIDIKPMIRDLKVELGESILLKVLLSAGGEENLNPLLFLRAFRDFTPVDFKTEAIGRVGLYINEKGIIKEPI